MLPERFWSKVSPAGDCWIWTAALSGGYEVFRIGGRSRATHRLAYEDLIGEVPPGLVLDHPCLNKSCCNPYHLDPIPRGENVRRHFRTVTRCKHGHDYTEENTVTYAGYRRCRACKNAAERKRLKDLLEVSR